MDNNYDVISLLNVRKIMSSALKKNSGAKTYDDSNITAYSNSTGI